MLSYNLSEQIRKSLNRIESLRKDILLTPIPPAAEQKLRWETKIQRTYWSLSLSGNPLTGRRMQKLIESNAKTRLSLDQREILSYKSAQNYIERNWRVTSNTVNSMTLVNLYDIACFPTVQKSPKLSNSKVKELDNMLNYLQTAAENPVIQAGVAQIHIVRNRPFPDGNGRVARLTALLFLYKYGYDFRGLLNISEYYKRDEITLRGVTQSSFKRENLTIWLEYFSKAIATQLAKAKQNIERSVNDPLPEKAYWNISARQKDIMGQLEIPGSTVTNKDVRKTFKVSQITASRDLSKLLSLGLLFSRGKGRSIRYYRN